MELNEIRYFLATARELNFTRAAAICGVSQPSLTRAIQKLEADLGGALFLRRPRQVELTRLGRELLPRFSEIMQNLEAVRQQASEVADAGITSLRLGVMCTIAPSRLVSLLTQLKAKQPEISVTIVEATAKRIVDLVLSDEVDVGIAAWPRYPESVLVQPLFEERYVFAVHADDPLTNETNVSLKSLEGCRYLERLSCEFDHYYEARHGAWSIDLDVCFSSEREDWIAALILAGEGCAIVPELMEMHPDVAKLALVDPVVTREVSLLTLRGRRLTEAGQAFLRLAARHAWAPAP